MKLTYVDVMFISLILMLSDCNDAFMTEMKYHHIPFLYRTLAGLFHWGVLVILAAGVWRLLAGKDRWS